MPQKSYVHRETAITFQPSGGSVLFTPTGIATATGWISDQWDRGIDAVAERYIWRAATKVATNPALGAFLTVYIFTSDGTYADGNLPTTDQALPAADRRRNLNPTGVLQADVVSTTQVFTRSGVVEILDRYVQVCWYNEFGVALSSTAADHFMSLTPAPSELQEG